MLGWIIGAFIGYCISDCIRFVTLLCNVDALRQEVDDMRWSLLQTKYDVHQIADKLGVTVEQHMETKNDRDKAAKI